MTTATISAVLPRLRRRSELGLILFSAVIIGGAYTLASLGRTASIPANIGPFLGVVVGLVLIAHLAVRRLAPAADGILLPVAGLLNGLGYVVIARLDQRLAGLQAAWTAVGILAFVLTLLVVRRTRDLQAHRYTFALVGVGLLLLPLLPGIGRPVLGARVWVFLGPMSFQPGEVAKVLKVLDERERTILCLRFGLDGGGERTLEEVAEHFGLTRERIRQIEARAMSKLRHPSADVGARELLEAV